MSTEKDLEKVLKDVVDNYEVFVVNALETAMENKKLKEEIASLRCENENLRNKISMSESK